MLLEPNLRRGDSARDMSKSVTRAPLGVYRQGARDLSQARGFIPQWSGRG